MSSPDEEQQRWVPTHVQVTVLRGRGLRGKGKHGTSDAYVVIQLGKEKYSTRAAEKTTEPEWREECSFQLQPGGPAAASGELVLTVMHRAVIGLDVFLGQAVVRLEQVFQESRGVKTQWYRLNSKTGKKEKERGDIQVSVQFTRNNLTASMYDLVMKDKSASTFSKLKERMGGKRRSSDEDSSSAVLPGGHGSLCRMRQRLPSDGGGEEDYEDDEGGEVRRSKMRTFFLRGKLRKSSDTRSSTSLGSESSESSRGGSLSPTAGISVVVSDLSNSPSNSSNLTADSPEHTADTSPKLSPLRCDFNQDFHEITIAVPQLTHNLRPPDHGAGEPGSSLDPGHLQKTLPLSVSLQSLHPRAPADVLHGTVGDGRRWSFDKAGEEEAAAIAAALEKSCPAPGGGEEPGGTETAPCTGAAGKHTSWFGSKELHSKPSLAVSHKLDSDTNPTFLPQHPPPLHHSNPFCRSQLTMSPANPFLSFLQHNPFYEDMVTPPLTSSLPPMPFLSSSRPPIAQLFPQSNNLTPTQCCGSPSTEDFVPRFTNAALSTGEAFSKKAANPFTGDQEPDPGWDESFEAFASDRLQVPQDCTTADQICQGLVSSRPQEHGTDQGTNTNGNDTLNPKPSGLTIHCLDTIPEDASFDYHNEMFSTFTISQSSRHPELHQANSSTNTNILTDANTHPAACHTSSLPDPAGSSGIGSSVDDDFLACLSSYSVSDVFSAGSSDETEPQKSERSVLSSEILSESAISCQDCSAYDYLPTDAAQKTMIPNEHETVEADWSDPEGSGVLTLGLKGADIQTPTKKDLQPKPNISPPSNHQNEEKCQGESSGSMQAFSGKPFSTLPSLYITTFSPDTRKSLPLEDMGGQEGHQQPLGPFRLFGEPFTANSKTFDQNASSFLQSLYVTPDSQSYQSCRSQPSSMLEFTEKLDSENLCEEFGAIPSPEDSNSSSKKQIDWFPQSLVMEDKTGTCEPGITANGDERLPVLPATLKDFHLKARRSAVLDDLFVRKPLLLHRSRSEGTLATTLDNLLPLSLWNELQELSSSQCDTSLFTPSAAPLTPQSSCLPSLPSPLSGASAPPSVFESPARAKPKLQEAQERRQCRENSPHPVKPLSAGAPAEGRSVLEKLKSTIHPRRSSHPGEQEAEEKKALTEGAGSYYHLTHSELVGLLVRREAELERRKAEFQQQKALLAKREAELRRLKPQVRDLEDYIDTLLVRIMEQTPTLLQVRSKLK
ncbi:uncharacterized protein rab11fip5a [Entelurus aequoreus]|uniref:uncharacterized protein rab11fip5a n=1 Tax=Entelurus aequoreus TaxID=161455 RepID=UPI002B1E83BB|nr:uncharacterized protein rab11fip5a [Entelurus aequoreus]